MHKRVILLLVLVITAGTQYGCGYLAAAGAGAAIGAEVANDDEE